MAGIKIVRAARLATNSTGGTSASLAPYDRDNGQAGIIAPQTPGCFRTLVGLVSSRASIGRFVPSRNMTITTAAFTVTTFSAADDACCIGVFNAGLTTLLATTGSTTGKLNTAIGVKTIPLAVSLTAGVTYHVGFSVGVLGGAPVVEGLTLGTSLSGELFGTGATVRENGFQASAHPLTAPFTPGVISAVPLVALRES